MKKIILLSIACLVAGTIWSQAPQSFKYQAVARNNDGTAIANATIGLKIQIKQGSMNGSTVYAETFAPVSNGIGVFTVNIGNGSPVSGNFADIDWSTGTYYLHTAMDASGGTNYTDMGTTQLLSVPYSLFTNSIYVHYANDTLYIGDQYVVISGGGSNTGTVTDYDGNEYETVVIGTQTWMKENLRSLHYSNGNPIEEVYAYDDNESNVAALGRLYTWYSVMGINKSSGTRSGNICPDGWHVPNVEESEILEDYLGGNMVAGGKMKETGYTYWLSPNEGATNESGFSARGSGQRGTMGNYDNFKEAFYIWTTEENNDVKAINWGLYYNTDNSVVNQVHPKTMAYSVRCLKD